MTLNETIEALEAKLAALKSQAASPAASTVKVGDLEWQADVPDQRFTWEGAKKYAASLGDGWRLPTVKELLTLVDYDRHNPACTVLPDCPSEWFWSSSVFSGGTASAWSVTFNTGYADNYFVGSTARVRCVR